MIHFNIKYSLNDIITWVNESLHSAVETVCQRLTLSLNPVPRFYVGLMLEQRRRR